MTAEEFKSWLDAMDISANRAAELLGVHANTITAYKTNGAPLTVALACSALYHRMEPWGLSAAGKNAEKALRKKQEEQIGRMMKTLIRE